MVTGWIAKGVDNTWTVRTDLLLVGFDGFGLDWN
jgi:hypothetical protein